jgi:hypothetical protein
MLINPYTYQSLGFYNASHQNSLLVWRCSSVVEVLSNMCKTLGSIPCNIYTPTKKESKRERKERRRWETERKEGRTLQITKWLILFFYLMYLYPMETFFKSQNYSQN